MSILFISQEEEITNINISRYRRIEYSDDNISVLFLNDGIINEYDHLITNEDGSILGFMLGEIYGIEHSLEKLIAKGHIFKTKTDIEYVIHLYEEYGLNALQHLNGKFVIFIIDKIKQDYILLNDRYGFKTYYYNLDNNNGFIFSNVPKLITQNMKEKKIDEDGLKDFFNFGFPINDRTLVKNIKKLSPASILKINKESMVKSRYWNWNEVIKKRISMILMQQQINLGNYGLKQ